MSWGTVVGLPFAFGGCWAVAAGAGAEAAYVATQEDRTAGETIDDQRITATVKSRLLADRTVSGMDINVDTFRRVVVLKGVVESGREAAQAIDIATAVNGVERVTSKLVVMTE